MRSSFLGILIPSLALLLGVAAGDVLAQERVVLPASQVDARPRMSIAGDTIRSIATRHAPRARLDVVSGIVRARYRIDDAPAYAGSAGEAARRHLTASPQRYGVLGNGDDLRIERETATGSSRHVEFRQMLGSYPVYGATVKVNLDAQNRVTMVLNNYRTHLTEARLAQPVLEENEVLQAVADLAGVPIAVVVEPKLMVYPSEEPRLAWHVIARPNDDSAEWSILVDATDGETIVWFDQSAHRRKGAASGATTSRATTSRATTSGATTVDGSGSVFDPDPLTTAGVEYGPPYVDANDADIPELNAQRRSVTLRDITRGVDGLYRLDGPYVRIVSGDVVGAPYTPPAVSSSDGFHFTRSSPYFEAVNAYYHIDTSQRYVQQIAPELDIHRFPIRVNPHGMGADDDSQYRPASNALLFGRGGIDDAEDAHVLLHEYAHALLEASSPGLLAFSEGRALHEGWADYWAVSYTRELIETGAVPPRDWRKVFTWDGNDTWQGRRMEHSGVYPADAPCTRLIQCDIYADGRLWATTLMEIYPHVGRRVMDHLNLLSHAYLTSSATMRDAAEAIIQADQDHYDGAHLSILLEAFRRRGFVGSFDIAPVIAHSPPPSTEEVTGSIRFEAEVMSDATAIEEVRVVVLGGEAPERFPLQLEVGSLYAAQIPLPGVAGDVRYYIEVLDDAGQTVVHPGAAPASFITIEIGPDEEPPTIAHDPPPQVNEADWPARLTAVVRDRMGVDAVWVEYAFDRDGATETGEFELEGGSVVFEGTFPDIPVETGRPVRYRIVARDAARAGNTASVPEEGMFVIDVIGGSLLRFYTFDGETDEGVVATGAWQRGTPRYGTRLTRSGSSVWATSVDGSYPDQTSRSTLTLPPVALGGHDGAYLVFWHWYDIEHDGRAFPESTTPATLWDGGNIKISRDGGSSWELLTPLGEYPGRVSTQHGNPLAGEPAYGGYSRGWRREIVPLPSADEALIRFDFGTDTGNLESAVNYAGWYIDDVQIRTVLEPDEIPPSFISVPAERVTAGSGNPAVRLDVEVEDDTGVESVRMHYHLLDENGGLVARDTLSFDMSAASATRFSLEFIPAATVEPSYRVEYQLSARDFDGNETWSTASGGNYRIDYLYHEQVSLLDGIRHTGLWTWSDSRWVTAWRQEAVPRSSLVIGPLDLPTDVSELAVHLEHRYQMGDGVGGNLKVSDDDGRSWTVLVPEEGYDAHFVSDGRHDMADEPIFTGTGAEPHVSSFDVSAYAGRQIRLRLDYGASRPAGEGDWWSVGNAVLNIVAADDDLPVPLELRLHANYPDPFSDRTTIGYTLPQEDIILLEVYDILGRRVDVIRYALQPPGTYTITYDGSRLSSGVYLLSMIVGSRRLVEQMVVAR